MFIRVPIYISERTDVEDINGEPFAGLGGLNTDNIDFYHEDTEEQVIVGLSSGASVVIALKLEAFESLLESYEIKVYDN